METAVQPLSAHLAQLRGVDAANSNSSAHVVLMADVLTTLDAGLVPYLRNTGRTEVTVPLELPLHVNQRGTIMSGTHLRVRWLDEPTRISVLQVGTYQQGSIAWSDPMGPYGLTHYAGDLADLNTSEELATAFADVTGEVIRILDEQMEHEAQLWMEHRAVALTCPSKTSL